MRLQPSKQLEPRRADRRRELLPFRHVVEEALEQQRGDRFRRAASRQLLDRLAANDQAAIGAVHIGQHGFGSNHIIETRHGFLPSQPVSMCGIARLSVNLDQCNQYVPVIDYVAWISRDEVLRLLGLRPQTLYAYVVAKADSGASGPRRSAPQPLFARRRRSACSRGACAAAGRPWSPKARSHGAKRTADRDLHSCRRAAVLSRPRRRGISSRASLEEAAALLWDVPAFPRLSQDPAFNDGPAAGRGGAFDAGPGCRPAPTRPKAGQGRRLWSKQRCCCARWRRALGADLADGVTVAAGFARAWNCSAHAGEAIRVALVLTADHELNASTFAARVTASTGAPLAAAALSGLATLLGPSMAAPACGSVRCSSDAGARGRESRRAATACSAATRCRVSATRSIPTSIRALRRCLNPWLCRMSPSI